MNLGLEGKTAIVTGGNRGIGEAIARALVAEGASVLLVARDEARLREAAQRMSAGDQRRAVGFAVDLREPDSAERAVAQALAHFGALDILVNCAGATPRGDFFALTEADWDDGFALKFRACVRMTREAWPHLQASGGSVLNIVGIGGHTPMAEFTIGGTVNAAMMHFTKAMATIGQAQGVRVNALNPGHIQTERLARNIDRLAGVHGVSREETAQRLLTDFGIQRFGQPDEIGAVAAFMLSSAASYMHGALVDVDGGERRGL